MGFCFHQDSYVTGEKLWWKLWRTPGKKVRTKSTLRSLGKVSQQVRRFIPIWGKSQRTMLDLRSHSKEQMRGFLVAFSGIVPTHPCPGRLRDQWGCKQLASEFSYKSHSSGWENLFFLGGRRHRHLQEKQIEGVPRWQGQRDGVGAPEPW